MRIIVLFLLLFTAPVLIAQDLSDNEFSLIQAAEQGNTSQILKLLEADTDVNCAGYDGMTPLHYAVQNGHLKAGQMLVLNGARIDATDVDRRSPLLLAVHFNHLDLAEYLVQKGADPNLADYYGLTPLFYAAAYGDYYMTDMFLFYKGHQKIRDAEGRTPFLAAIWGGFPHVAHLLKEYGADIEATDHSGYSALMLAVMNRDSISVDSLLQWGVNTDLVSKGKLTALELAIKQGDAYLVERLISAGSEINHEIQKGLRTIDYAVMIEKDTAITQMLLNAGANPRKGIMLTNWNLGPVFSFNDDESTIGLLAEWYDLKNQFGVQASLDQRAGRIQVEHQFNDSAYFIFREARTSMHLGVFKLYPFLRLSQGAGWGLKFSLDGGISAGSYKSSITKAPIYYSARPGIGLYLSNDRFRWMAGYTYRIDNNTQVRPSMITVSVLFALTKRPS